MAKSEEKCVPLHRGRERLLHEVEVATMTFLFQKLEILDEKRVQKKTIAGLDKRTSLFFF